MTSLHVTSLGSSKSSVMVFSVTASLPWHDRELTTELSDASGSTCSHWQLTYPARVRSSNLVRPFHFPDLQRYQSKTRS